MSEHPLRHTWIRNDDAPAIADDIAPPGFSVVHVLRPRTTTVGRNVGGGLAVIARDGLSRSTAATNTHYFGVAHYTRGTVVKLTIGRQSLTIVNLYRPPESTPSSFYSELADLLSAVVTNTDSAATLTVRAVLPRPSTQT